MRRCSNDFTACPAQRRELLFHFCSRGGMDIQSIGRSVAQTLTGDGLVVDPGDLYLLTEDRLKGAARLGTRSARRILTEVEKSKDRPLRRVLYALGIRHVGARGAELLAEAFGSLEALQAASQEEIGGVKGIGPKIAASVYQTLRDPAYVAFVRKLDRGGVISVISGGAYRRTVN